jgi:hypothetical protein
MVSPLVVIWSVTTNQGNKVMGFLGQGLVLMFQPMLIVVSMILFMFALELAYSMSDLIFGMLNSNVKASFGALSSASEGNVISSVYIFSMFSAFENIVNVLILMFGVVLGFKIIFSDDWFFKLFGHDGNIAGSSTTRGSGESLSKVINPVGV